MQPFKTESSSKKEQCVAVYMFVCCGAVCCASRCLSHSGASTRIKNDSKTHGTLARLVCADGNVALRRTHSNKTTAKRMALRLVLSVQTGMSHSGASTAIGVAASMLLPVLVDRYSCGWLHSWRTRITPRSKWHSAVGHACLDSICGCGRTCEHAVDAVCEGTAMPMIPQTQISML